MDISPTPSPRATTAPPIASAGSDAAGVDAGTGADVMELPVGRTGVLAGALQGVVDSLSSVAQLLPEVVARVHRQAARGD